MTEICPICNNEVEEDATSCPYCGFKMLGSTQSFKPVAVEDEVRHVKQLKTYPELVVVRGPQDGISFEISEGDHIIGRNPRCEIFLNDMTVSRKHATISCDHNECVIRDENSFNGVWVNDESVVELPLKSGDVIQIGAFTLVFRIN